MTELNFQVLVQQAHDAQQREMLLRDQLDETVRRLAAAQERIAELEATQTGEATAAGSSPSSSGP